MDSKRHEAVAGYGCNRQIGFYAPGIDQADARESASRVESTRTVIDMSAFCQADIRMLASLSASDLQHIDCLIADIRTDASRVLRECRLAARVIPVIALCDVDQHFPDDYPFGTFVSDLTTPDELGHSIFWQRVKQAVDRYDTPLSINDVDSPAYSVFKSIADHTSDWILVKDLQHRFVVAGKQFAEVAGTSIDDIIGHNDLEIGSSERDVRGDPATGKAGFWTQDDTATRSGVVSVEENPEWVLYSESARHRRTSRVPLKNPAGDVYALLVCSQDITEQMSNERLLAERTIMLEQVIDEKQRAELNRKVAEDAVEAKTRFLAATSHDLRQPLHAIGLFLHGLDKSVEGREERNLIEQIKQSCTSLNTLFNSCLDISRLDAGVVERKLEHFHASVFLESLNEEFRRQALDKGLDYRLTLDSSIVHSDEVLLSRIIRNLLSNALQNTDNGYLSIECRNVGAKVQMTISDSGCGIADEELQSVFNEYHQINPENARLDRGLGLGLAIVKRLCEFLDISITLESQLGAGTCFTLSIPAGELSGLRNDTTCAPVTLPDSLLILIVEDDQNVRNGMQVLLESYGCRTLCAADSASAHNMLGNPIVVPDIIIADYHLSNGATGIQAIREIRTYLNKRIPALLVTGDTSTHSERESADNDLPMLYKPVNSEALLAAINGEVRRTGVYREEPGGLLV